MTIIRNEHIGITMVLYGGGVTLFLKCTPDVLNFDLGGWDSGTFLLKKCRGV